MGDTNVWSEVVTRLRSAYSEIDGTLTQASDRKMPTIDLQAVEGALAIAQRNSKARQGLITASKRKPEPQIPELEAAMREAGAAGLPIVELDECKAALALAKRRLAAREKIRVACNRKPEPTVDELEAAIAQAKEVDIPKDEVKVPEEALALAKRRVLARESLRVACDREPEPEIEELEAALTEARNVKIPSQELCEAEEALEWAKARKAARKALRVACDRRPEPMVDELEAAISQGKDVELKDNEFEEANYALEQAKRRAAARAKLRVACDRQPEPIVQELAAALEEAKHIIPSEELDECKEALDLAKLRVTAREKLRAACAIDLNSVSACEELRQALDLAREAKLPTSEMQEAKSKLLLAQRILKGLAMANHDVQPCIPRDQWSCEWHWE